MFRQPPLLRVLWQVVEPEAAQGLVGGAVLPQELQLPDRHQVRVFPHLIIEEEEDGFIHRDSFHRFIQRHRGNFTAIIVDAGVTNKRARALFGPVAGNLNVIKELFF